MVFPYQCSPLIPSLRNTISVQRLVYLKLALTSFPTYTPPRPRVIRQAPSDLSPPPPTPSNSVYYDVLKLIKKTQNVF